MRWRRSCGSPGKPILPGEPIHTYAERHRHRCALYGATGPAAGDLCLAIYNVSELYEHLLDASQRERRKLLLQVGGTRDHFHIDPDISILLDIIALEQARRQSENIYVVAVATIGGQEAKTKFGGALGPLIGRACVYAA